MISNFRHKGLRRYFEEGDARGISAEHTKKILVILTALNEAGSLDDLDIPGFRTHPLSGKLRDRWSIVARANWRIVFRFEDGVAHDVDLVDYH